jgi:hypothetical protein
MEDSEAETIEQTKAFHHGRPRRKRNPSGVRPGPGKGGRDGAVIPTVLKVVNRDEELKQYGQIAGSVLI